MGRPRRYREPVKGPFDFLALAWSRQSRVKARRGNRRAWWWLSDLWYEPHYLLMVIGILVVILLLLGSGAVRGAACMQGAGCVTWGEQGIATTEWKAITVPAP